MEKIKQKMAVLNANLEKSEDLVESLTLKNKQLRELNDQVHWCHNVFF